MSDLLSNLAPWPKADFSEFGAVEVKKLGRMQTLIGSVLGRNWVSIPHVTHHDDADITDLELRRKAHNAGGGTKLTIVPLLVKALADALVAFPQFNASLDPQAGTIVLKKYVHIGVAVDTPKGEPAVVVFALGKGAGAKGPD